MSVFVNYCPIFHNENRTKFSKTYIVSRESKYLLYHGIRLFLAAQKWQGQLLPSIGLWSFVDRNFQHSLKEINVARLKKMSTILENKIRMPQKFEVIKKWQ